MVQIGNIQVRLDTREIEVDGELISIGSRAFSILELLIRAEGTLVSKDDIIREVWPDTIVQENNLQVHIATLRRVFGKHRDLIRTVSGRGYVLVRPALEVSAPRAAPATLPASVAAGQTPLFGRQALVAEIGALLERHRTVTLVGPGGIGKTSVALAVAAQAASRFEGGVHFIALADVSEQWFVPDAVASALGINAPTKAPTRGPTKAPAGQLAIEQMVNGFAGRRTLIVLDNCEHVIEAAAELAERFASSGADTVVLATSREALRARGETLFSIAPLDTPQEGDPASAILEASAVQLFLARIHAANQHFPTDARTLDHIAQVCRRLDGIPLAIELAAARAATLGIEPLAEHLDDRFRILAGGPRTALPRHQTLKAAFDWSYRLLNDVERTLFRRLGVFVSGFTFDAAAHVMAPQRSHAETLHALSGLVSKSLVVLENSDVPRYRMLESTRAYALQQLQDNGEARSAAQTHALYFMQLFQQRPAGHGAPPAPHDCALARHELGNLRAALDWAFGAAGDPCVGSELAAAAVPLLFDMALIDECAKRAAQALQVIEQLEQCEQLKQLEQPGRLVEFRSAVLRLNAAYAAALAYSEGPADAVLQQWTQVLADALALSDLEIEARAIWGLWEMRQCRGDARGALVHAYRFAACARRSGRESHQIMARRVLGIALHYIGNQHSAREHLESVIDASSHAVHRWHTAGARIDHGICARATLARVRWAQGDHADALTHARTALGAAIDHADEMTTCYVLCEASVPLALLMQDATLARDANEALRTRAQRAGFSGWLLCSEAYDACVACMTDREEPQMLRFSEAIDQLQAAGCLAPVPFLLGQLATAWLSRDNHAEALLALDDALRLSKETGNKWYYAALCRIRADIALAMQSEHEAQTWLLAALEHAARQGAFGFGLTAVELAGDAG
ncbi:winged helix-turn-helix domain-containing protein [Paraburkholderia jirisanensis]